MVGNGSRYFATIFREDLGVDFPIFIELLSPRLITNGVRALAKGSRQKGVQGDAFQLGGSFVIRRGGGVAFAHRSREAGDHADLDRLIASLR